MAVSTRVKLYRGVNIPVDNSHQIDFTSRNQQESFFNSLLFKSFNDIKYTRVNQNFTLSLNVNFDDALSCDYLSFINPRDGIEYYAFINTVDYVNENNTRFITTLDVFQTFMFSYTLGKCYVEREHTTQYVNGRPVINTVPEGLNIGTEYQTVSQEKMYLYYDDGGRPIHFMLIVSKGALESSDAGIGAFYMSSTPTPLHYYIVPFNEVYNTDFIVNDVDSAYIDRLMRAIGQDEKSVNKVVSMSVLPYLPLRVSSISGQQPCRIYIDNVTTVDVAGVPVVKIKNNAVFDTPIYNKGKYDGMTMYKNSKLLMHPYSYTELSDGRGNTMTIKNEYVEGDNLKITVTSALSSMNKVAYLVENYNGEDKAIANALIDVSNNDITIVNEQTAAFMQSSRNAFTNSRNMGLIGAVTSGVSAGGIAGMAIGSVAPGVGTTIGGVVGGVVGAGINVFKEVSAINAKMDDMNNTPANISNQGGNIGFDIGNNIIGLLVTKRQLKEEHANIVNDYFTLYGYKINRWKVPNTISRSDFNFVKTVDALIRGNIATTYKQMLANMYNSGITIWHNRKVGE